MHQFLHCIKKKNHKIKTNTTATLNNKNKQKLKEGMETVSIYYYCLLFIVYFNFICLICKSLLPFFFLLLICNKLN